MYLTYVFKNIAIILYIFLNIFKIYFLQQFQNISNNKIFDEVLNYLIYLKV